MANSQRISNTIPSKMGDCVTLLPVTRLFSSSALPPSFLRSSSKPNSVKLSSRIRVSYDVHRTWFGAGAEFERCSFSCVRVHIIRSCPCGLDPQSHTLSNATRCVPTILTGCDAGSSPAGHRMSTYVILVHLHITFDKR